MTTTPQAGGSIDDMIDAAVASTEQQADANVAAWIEEAAARAASNPAVMPSPRKLEAGEKGRAETLRTPTAPKRGTAGEGLVEGALADYGEAIGGTDENALSRFAQKAAAGVGDAVGQLVGGIGLGIQGAAAQVADLVGQPEAAEFMRGVSNKFKRGMQFGRLAFVPDEREYDETRDSAAYMGANAITQAAAGVGLARATSIVGRWGFASLMASYYGTSLEQSDRRISEIIAEGNRRRLAAGLPEIDEYQWRDAIGAHFNAVIETGTELVSDKLQARVLAKTGALRAKYGRLFGGAIGGAATSAAIEGTEELVTEVGQLAGAQLSPQLEAQLRREAIAGLRADGIDPFAADFDTERAINARILGDAAVRMGEAFIWGAVGGAGAHVIHRSATGAKQERQARVIGRQIKERAQPIRDGDQPVAPLDDAMRARMTEAEFADAVETIRRGTKDDPAAVRVDPDTIGSLGLTEETLEGLEFVVDPGSGDTVLYNPQRIERDAIESLLSPIAGPPQEGPSAWVVVTDKSGRRTSLASIAGKDDAELLEAWKTAHGELAKGGNVAKRVDPATAEKARRQILAELLEDGAVEQPTHEIHETSRAGDTVRVTRTRIEPEAKEARERGGKGGTATAAPPEPEAVKRARARAAARGGTVTVEPFAQARADSRGRVREMRLDAEAERRRERAAATPDRHANPARIQRALSEAAVRESSEGGRVRSPRIASEEQLTTEQREMRDRLRRNGRDVVYYTGLAQPAIYVPSAPSTLLLSARGAPGQNAGLLAQLEHDSGLLAHEDTHRARRQEPAIYGKLADVISPRAVTARIVPELHALVNAGHVEGPRKNENPVEWIDRITAPDYRPPKRGMRGGAKLADHLLEEAVANARQAEVPRTGVARQAIDRSAGAPLRAANQAAIRLLTRLGLRGRFAARALEANAQLLADAAATDTAPDAPAQAEQATEGATARAEPSTATPAQEEPQTVATDAESEPKATEGRPGDPPAEAGVGAFPPRAAAGIVFGDETTVVTGTRESLRAWWGVVEADELQASNVATASNGRGGFPRNDRYDDQNERAADYENPTAGSDSIAVVTQIAANPQPAILVNNSPEPVTGAPIITRSGSVLGGNARTMGIQRAYSIGSADAYRAAVRARSGEFGIDPARIESMREPVLVRMLESPGKPGELSRALNERLQAGKSATVDATSRAAKLPEDAIRFLSVMLTDDEGTSTLRGAMSGMSREQTDHLVDLLRSGGVWSQAEAARFVNEKGKLDADGVDLLEGMLVSLAIDGPDVAAVLQSAGAGVRGKLAALAPRITAARSQNVPAVPDLRKALYWATAARQPWKQSQLPAREYFLDQASIVPVPWFGDRVVAALAVAMDELGPRKFAGTIGSVLESAGDSMFATGEPKAFPQAVAEALESTLSKEFRESAGPAESWQFTTHARASEAAPVAKPGPGEGVKFSRAASDDSPALVDITQARTAAQAGRYGDADGNAISVSQALLDATSPALRDAIPDLLARSSGGLLRRLMVKTSAGPTRVHMELRGDSLRAVHLVPAKTKTPPATASLSAGGRPGVADIVALRSAIAKTPGDFSRAATRLVEGAAELGYRITGGRVSTTPAAGEQPRRDSLYLFLDWAPRPFAVRLSDHARTPRPGDAGLEWIEHRASAPLNEQVSAILDQLGHRVGRPLFARSPLVYEDQFGRMMIRAPSLWLGRDREGQWRIFNPDRSLAHHGSWSQSERLSAQRFLDRLEREMRTAAEDELRAEDAARRRAAGIADGTVATMSDLPRQLGESDEDYALRRKFREAELPVHTYDGEKDRARAIAEAAREHGVVFARAQIDTPEFRQWFGESKVVDQDGRPAVVFHGTAAAEFDAFDLGRMNPLAHIGPGIYATDDKVLGSSYAHSATMREGPDGGHARVMPLYMRIERPAWASSLVNDDEAARLRAAGLPVPDPNRPKRGYQHQDVLGYFTTAIHWMREEHGPPPSEFENDQRTRHTGSDQRWHPLDVRDAYERAGFDGFRSSQGVGVVWIAFRPEQVKSATGNRGTFAIDDARLLFARDSQGGMSARDAIERMTGIAPDPGRAVGEREALREQFKAQERAASTGWKAGRTVGIQESAGRWRAAKDRLEQVIARLQRELKARTDAGRREADDLRDRLLKELQRIPVAVRGKATMVKMLRTVSTPEEFDVALAKIDYELSLFALRKESGRVRKGGATLRSRSKKIGENHRERVHALIEQAEDSLYGPADAAGNRRIRVTKDARRRRQAGTADPTLGRVQTEIEALRSDARAHWQRATAASLELDEAYEAWTTGRLEQIKDKALRRQTVAEAAQQIGGNVRKAKDPIGPSHGRLQQDRRARLLDRVADMQADMRTLAGKVEGKSRGLLHSALVVRPRRAESRMLVDLRRILGKVDDAARRSGFKDLADAMARISGGLGDASRSYVAPMLAGRKTRITLGEALGLVALDPDSRMLLENDEDMDGGGTPIQFRDGRQREALPVSIQEIEELEQSLPPAMVAFVGELKALLETEIRPKLFKVHRSLNGFEPPAIEGYWPRSRNRDEVVALSPDASTQQVVRSFFENAGFLKAREGGGGLPIVVGDVLDVFLDHLDQSLRVIHFAHALRIGDTLLRQRPLVEAVGDRWGAEANRRLRLLLHHGMGVDPGTRGPIERAWSLAYANLARAMLPLNVRTWIRQLGGVPKLLHSFAPADLARAVPRALVSWQRKADYETLWAHSGYLWRRHTSAAAQRWTQNRDDRVRAFSVAAAGRRLQAAGRSIASGDVRDAWRNVSNSFDAIQTLNAVDRFIAMVGFEAARIEARRRRPRAAQAWIDKRAAQRAEDAFRDTQNVSSPLDDTVMVAWSKNASSTFFPFSSDPIKSWNMLVSSRRRGKGAFARSLSAVAANAAWSAVAGGAWTYAIKSLAASAAGDDEETRKRERWAKYLADLQTQVAKDLSGLVYGGDSLLDAARIFRSGTGDLELGGAITSAVAPIERLIRESGKLTREPAPGSKQRTPLEQTLVWTRLGLEIAGVTTGQPFTPLYRDAVEAPLKAMLEASDGALLKTFRSQHRKLLDRQREALRAGTPIDQDEQQIMGELERRIAERQLRRASDRLKRERSVLD